MFLFLQSKFTRRTSVIEECIPVATLGGCVFISITFGEQLWQNREKNVKFLSFAISVKIVISTVPLWGSCVFILHNKGESVVRSAAPLFVRRKIVNFVNFVVCARPSQKIVDFVNPEHKWTSLANNTFPVYHKNLKGNWWKRNSTLFSLIAKRAYLALIYFKKFNSSTPTRYGV